MFRQSYRDFKEKRQKLVPGACSVLKTESVALQSSKKHLNCYINFLWMKKLLLFTLFLFVSAAFRAQSWIYHPFPADSAVWMEDHVDSDGYHTFRRTYLLGDTLIGGLNYKKLYETTTPMAMFAPVPFGDANYIGALRDDILSRKVYFKDPYSAETLLFDFTLPVGGIATIDNYVCSGSIDTILVTSIDSVLVNGSYSKRFHLAAPAGSWCTPGNIIEGVGGDAGFREFFTGGFEFSNQLLCMSVKKVNVYPSGSMYTSYNCAYAVGIAELENGKLKLTIAPNPAADNIHLSVRCDSGYDLELSDERGMLVYSRKDLQGSGPDIDLSGFANGMYFIRLTEKDGNFIIKKVVKN
jgi:hypothetical protein